jgi:gliding motility-associated-like protein
MKRLLLYVLALFTVVAAQGQTVQLYNEDFEDNFVPFTLNQGGVGNATGSNKWTINNLYSGAPVYPNTTPQDQTVSGTISFAPTSRYLHIHDTVAQSVQGIGNANWNPLSASDQFAYTTNGFCTLGFTDVNFTFFWLAEGNANAYGEVYYSINNGPWVQTGLSQYKNQNLWKYEIITDPIFNNQPNVRFGFRWVNGAGGPPLNMSFAIDDINVVGTYDTQNPVTINITNVTPVPVCQGNGVLLFWQLSQPLCDGVYEIELSDINGNFSGNPTSLGVFNIVNNQTTGAIYPTIPSNTPAGTCYKVRINRVSPAPAITGEVSICFEVAFCPNTITTLQPVVTMDPDTVCAGSVIDVPFYSTGVYINNTYVAQLSAPDGTFSTIPPPLGLGAFPNSDTYDPAQGSLPGNVSGLIPDTVSEGCNYYIRVVSFNPVAIGTLYGPFCIRHCDVETNNKQDIRFCINELEGADTTITYTIHNYDTTSTYTGTNQFLVQVLNSQTLAVINTGVIGGVVSNTSGTITVTIPNLAGLFGIGLQPGMYYIRVVATESDMPWDINGTIIRMTIGAPSAFPPNITAGAPYYCVGQIGNYTINPYNFQSDYQWWCNGINNGVPFDWEFNPLYVNFGGGGTLLFTVREFNYGCAGPASDTLASDVFGSPNVSIVGPSQVCVGDTVTYQVQFTNNTYYEWAITSSNTSIVDTSNNVITLVFDTVGTGQFNVLVVNPCGQDNGNKNVLIKPLPPANIGADTTICDGSTITLSTTPVNNGTYQWGVVGAQSIGGGQNKDVSPNDTTSYYVKVTVQPGCVSYDTLTVFVEYPVLTYDTLNICLDEAATLVADTGQSYSYVWSSGETTQSVTKTEAGDYYVDISVPGEVCLKTQNFHLVVDTCYVPLTLPNVFTPDGDGINDYWQPFVIGNFDEFEILVYNRWGTMVYTTDDPAFMWDGKNTGGNLVSDGVYYYIAKTKYEDKLQDFSGTVTVLGGK